MKACSRNVCSGSPPLCAFCVERELARPLLERARHIGERWGQGVFRRRPKGTWPHWDADATGRLRATAFRLVARLHADDQVRDRLARRVAYCAGLAYRDAVRRSHPDMIAAERELRPYLRTRRSPTPPATARKRGGQSR